MEYVEKIEDHGIVLKIHPDTDPSNPRDDDNAGTMVCFHKRYSLPNESKLNSADFNGWEALEKHLRKELRAVIVLPIYMYDHSGLAFSTKAFRCPWDSGQVGFIYVTRETILREFAPGNKKLSKKALDLATKYLEGEVETYHQFSSGGVYGYEVEDADGQHLDSCWGFYGLEYAREEGKSTMAYHVKQVQAELDSENNHGNGI